MSLAILNPDGEAYSVCSFQSLAGKETLRLRTGVAPREPNPEKYVAPRWCPTIDVLAVPEGKALRLVRLSGGQTVWRRTLHDQHSRTAPVAFSDGGAGSEKQSAADGQAIRAIAWHPANTCVAVLHADGTLVQRDAAKGDVIHESRINLEAGNVVAAMEWIQCESNAGQGKQGRVENGSGAQQPLEQYLPRLTSPDRSKAMPSHVNPTAEPLTAIIVVTTTGHVVVSLGGILTLPVAGMPKDIEAAVDAGSTCSAVDAKLDQQNHRLYIVYSVLPPFHHRAPATTSVLGSENARLAVCTLHVPLFAETAGGPLHKFTTLFARLSGLCLFLENALDLLIKESEARDEGASRPMLLDMLEGVLRDHGVDESTSPEAELIRLAIGGRASEPTSQFMLSKMKVTKLNSWESAGRMGAVAIVRLVYQHIQPAIERAILAIAGLQLTIDGWTKHDTFHTDKDGRLGDSRDFSSTKKALGRAVVIWGWLFARFEEYMVAVRDEQRENQEFADWALFAIDDLRWQNEGSRRADNDDADDGSRPVRPEIDYVLLLKFIRCAFRRETVIDPVDTRVIRMLYSSGTRSDEGKELLRAYALKWPSKVLGNSFCWDNASFRSFLTNMDTKSTDSRRVSDMRLVEKCGIYDGGCMYVATMLASSQTLELLMLPRDLAARPYIAWIDMVVPVRATDSTVPLAEVGADTSIPVHVSDVSFFDDSLLGLTFTIDECNSVFLGALEYSYNSSSTALRYHELPDRSSEHSLQLMSKSKLIFSRLLNVNEASSGHSTALASNGAKGRRCVAVVERRGKCWWPYDMDNEEDEEEEEDGSNGDDEMDSFNCGGGKQADQ
ncbi:hypothetical protein EV174_003311 [Coemansia sp. RSA 2320]|nr:hypothetical protein EV174_003311 [Coemansia sp. RSA 2320]